MLFPFALDALLMELYVYNVLLGLFSIVNLIVKNVVILSIIVDFVLMHPLALAA